MKKCFWVAALLALCLLLLAGCGSEKELSGTIVEYLREGNEVSAFLMEQDGKVIGVRLTDETGIYPDLVDITDEALRCAEYPRMGVTVTGTKAEESLTAADGTAVPTYTASVIIIDSIPYGEPLTLTDGTTIAVRQNSLGLAYYAPDGTNLVQSYIQIPNDILVARVDFDIVSMEVQDKIRAHYEELGYFFDTEYQVERAWAEYNKLGKPKDFRAYVLHQSTSCSFYNERAVFYSTCVTLSDSAHRRYDKYFHAVFDRETGEQIPMWSLFKPDESMMRQWLLIHLEPIDMEWRATLAESLEPEWISFGSDFLYILIPLDALPEGKGPLQAGLSYDEELTAMLQDWVLPIRLTEDDLPDGGNE